VIAGEQRSHTGQFLRRVLKRQPRRRTEAAE
jgi:hypothetical protein